MKERQSHGRGHADGFTLIEVVVALALLAIVMTTIFGIHSTGLRGLARAEEREQAAIVADGLLAQLGTATPVLPFRQLTGRAGDYHWTIQTMPYGGAGEVGARPDRLVFVRISVRRPDLPAFDLATLKLAGAAAGESRRGQPAPTTTGPSR